MLGRSREQTPNYVSFETTLGPALAAGKHIGGDKVNIMTRLKGRIPGYCLISNTRFLAEPDEARGYFTNTSVTNSFS